VADDSQRRERRFRQLYTEHFPAIHAYAVRRSDVPHDVADVVAEVFTVAWRRLDSVPEPPAERLWLYGVARRVLSDQYRSTHRMRGLLSRIKSQQVSAVSQPEGFVSDRVLSALRRLPDGEREALMLVVWEQLTHSEVAQVLGCSTSAVGTRLHRAKERLRQELAAKPQLVGGK
jgi:RNA polymerase sigma factor (sigma-70 family)